MLIFKEDLNFTKGENGFYEYTIALPVTAQILTIKLQYNSPVVWYMFNGDGLDKRYVKFLMSGTGWEVNHNTNNIKYISTEFQDGFVWHYFMEK